MEETGFFSGCLREKNYAIREVPNYLEVGTRKETAISLIYRVLEGERGVELYKEYAAMRACKASIKKNDQISEDILYELLEQLKNCEEPTRCPHGRPTVLNFSQTQIERMFYRT